MSTWLQTFTGKQVFPLQPSPESICIEDIAHSLSLLCRFAGHVKEFYSVGEHSLRASYLVPQEDALWALLHDASEAYLVDVPRPIKHSPEMAAYRAAEKNLMVVICERFGLPKEEPESVRRIDNTLLNTEQRDLLGPQVSPWVSDWTADPLPYTIRPYPQNHVEQNFLRRFYELDALRFSPAVSQPDGYYEGAD